MSPLMLEMERRYRILLPQADTVLVLLVGIGGTGSHLAVSLARLAVHARQRGMRVKLIFVDPDTVDEGNIGRQNFCFAELSQNKATTMALRLNAAFGLDVMAVPDYFQSKMIPSRNAGEVLLVGAVDNHRARQELAKAIAQADGRLWWLDVGNARWNGQCLIGNLPQEYHIELDKLGLCSGLPAPHVQEPGLLEPDPEEPHLSCADLVMREEQSLFVNQAAATVAAQYADQFVLKRELTSFDTCFNLIPFVATTKNITYANLSRYLDEEPWEWNGARGA